MEEEELSLLERRRLRNEIALKEYRERMASRRIGMEELEDVPPPISVQPQIASRRVENVVESNRAAKRRREREKEDRREEREEKRARDSRREVDRKISRLPAYDFSAMNYMMRREPGETDFLFSFREGKAARVPGPQSRKDEMSKMMRNRKYYSIDY